MAKRQGSNEDGRDDEINALLDANDVDTEAIAKQISGTDGGVSQDDKSQDDKSQDDKSQDDKSQDDKSQDDKSQDDKSQDDKSQDDKNKQVPDTKVIVDTSLKEIFGESFTSAEELKKADIPGKLKELETLRQKTQELETQVKAKPKHAFASDDLAKLNEFVRETGINDAAVFNKLNVADVANMDDVDALMLQHIVENPRLASRSPQEVRRYIETKYNVDPAKIDEKRVEAGEITQEELDQNKRDYEYSKMDFEADADKAKTKLLELKGKIKMPEPPEDDKPPEDKNKWTPEVEAEKKATWTTVNEKMGEQFAKLPIRVKGGTEPIVNFDISEEARKPVLQTALDYIVSNQMEVNEANVKSVAKMIYIDLKMQHELEMNHALFERARSMTEEEALKLYHNPSPRNDDNPPSGEEPKTEEERINDAYEAEMNR